MSLGLSGGLGSTSALDELIHNDLLDALPRVFHGLIDIQAQDREAAKLPDHSIDPLLFWTDVTGLTHLSAIVWPVSAFELRTDVLTNDTATHVAVISQALPDITAIMRAAVTVGNHDPAIIYNITAVQIDSQKTQTKLRLEIAKP